MLLYLTSSKNRDLIDEAVKERDFTVKKLVGKYMLQRFVVKDIRNYSAIRYFIVDASCTKDSIEHFCTALKSFEMMFPTKIIVVLSGNEKKQEYIDSLTAAGIGNLVTEDEPEIAAVQLLEYLTDAEAESSTAWTKKNIRIAVAGAQRRCGTTVTAMNLAFYLSAQGAKVCYAETNTNRHLRLILKVCGAAPEQEHYTFDGVDFFFSDEIDGDYDFIICDCGELQAVTDVFSIADKRLLCGSALPYELTAYKKAVSLCSNLSVQPVAVAVPDEMKDYCKGLFGIELLFADCSHTLFDEKKNEALYKEVVKEYTK